MSRRFSKRQLVHPELRSLPRSMPLIIPDDREYDISTNELRPIRGKCRSGLKIVSETLQLLEGIQRPVAVAAICGPYRTGKSYVLSRMLGSADAFELGHTMDAKTFGIWIGTAVLDCEEFTLVLMDTEGIDSVSTAMKNDASVLVMTVLLSSCLIYNSIGVPKHSDLEKMSHFAKLAESIAVKDSTGKTDESFQLKNYFPDFLWLLRDVTLIPTGVDGKRVSPTDFLMTKVFCRSRKFKESESDMVARAIMTFFPKITCKTIQPPSSDPAVVQNIASRQDCLHPQFNEQVEQLVQYLFEIVRGKKGVVAGKMADGPILAAMATHYVEAVNKTDAIPCITDTWQTAITMRCKKVMEQLLKEYDQEMERRIIEQGLPMEEDSQGKEDPTKPCTLFALHRSTLLQKTAALLEQVGHFLAAYAQSQDSSSALDKDSLCAELEIGAATFTEESTEQVIHGELVRKKVVMGGILLKYAQRNHSESRSSCNRLFTKLYGPIEEKMKHQSYTFENLLKDLQVLQEKYYRQAVGPAKWEVYTEKREYIKAQETGFKLLQGFKQKAFDEAQKAADVKAAAVKLEESVLTLQMQVKNDAEMNHKRIQELKEHHREEIEKLRKDEKERMERERQRSEDFARAQMKQMADITNEHSKQVNEQSDKMIEMMMTIYGQKEEALDAQANNMQRMEAMMNQQAAATTAMQEFMMKSTSDRQKDFNELASHMKMMEDKKQPRAVPKPDSKFCPLL